MKNKNTIRTFTKDCTRAKKGLTACLFLLVIFLMTGCAQAEAKSPVLSAVDIFVRQAENSKYTDALKTYNDKIAGDAALELEAANRLQGYLNVKLDAYEEEIIGQADFEAALQTVWKINDETYLLGWFPEEILDEYSEIAASKEAYREAVAQMENGDYEQAMESFSQVDPEDSKNYESAQEQYAKAETLYVKAILNTATEAVNSGSYDQALEVMELAEWTVDYQEQFETLKTTIATKKFEERMKTLSKSNDLASMTALYDEALQDPYCEISAEITTMLAGLKNNWRQSIIDRSVTAYKTGGYESAIPVISEGLAALPGDEQLLAYEQMYLSCAPTSLVDLAEHYVDAKWNGNNNSIAYSHKTVKDAYDNDHSEYLQFWMSRNCTAAPYIIMNLNGEYTKLNAACFVTSYDAEDNMGIRIYADGVLIYDSGLMTKMDDPEEISLNVTNVRLLKIESCLGSVTSGSHAKVYLTDAFLLRTLTDADF